MDLHNNTTSLEIGLYKIKAWLLGFNILLGFHKYLYDYNET